MDPVEPKDTPQASEQPDAAAQPVVSPPETNKPLQQPDLTNETTLSHAPIPSAPVQAAQLTTPAQAQGYWARDTIRIIIKIIISLVLTFFLGSIFAIWVQFSGLFEGANAAWVPTVNTLGETIIAVFGFVLYGIILIILTRKENLGDSMQLAQQSYALEVPQSKWHGRVKLLAQISYYYYNICVLLFSVFMFMDIFLLSMLRFLTIFMLPFSFLSYVLGVVTEPSTAPILVNTTVLVLVRRSKTRLRTAALIFLVASLILFAWYQVRLIL